MSTLRTTMHKHLNIRCDFDIYKVIGYSEHFAICVKEMDFLYILFSLRPHPLLSLIHI